MKLKVRKSVFAMSIHFIFKSHCWRMFLTKPESNPEIVIMFQVLYQQLFSQKVVLRTWQCLNT